MSTVSQRLLALVFTTLAVGAPLHAQRKTNILAAEEILQANLNVSNAYDVVQLLRPRWFAARGLVRVPMTSDEGLQGVGVRVWLNDHNAGGTDYLKTIPAERVQEMRFYSASEAASRFGSSDGQAAIEVTLKR